MPPEQFAPPLPPPTQRGRGERRDSATSETFPPPPPPLSCEDLDRLMQHLPLEVEYCSSEGSDSDGNDDGTYESYASNYEEPVYDVPRLTIDNRLAATLQNIQRQHSSRASMQHIQQPEMNHPKPETEAAGVKPKESYWRIFKTRSLSCLRTVWRRILVYVRCECRKKES